MTGKRIFTASIATLLIVVLIAIGYQVGRGRSGNKPQSIQEMISQRLAPLERIEARLEQLEKEVVALRQSASTEAREEAEKSAQEEDDRLAAIEESLATLRTRVNGLEQDPIQRGYSYLESENAEMRREGINMLTRAARFDLEVRAAIRALLSDPNARVREQAAQKLRDLKDKESESQMVAMLSDPYPRARRRAIQALGAIDAVAATRDIGRNLISDADDQVRETAVEVLRELKSPDAVEFLTEALKDKNEAVRGEAISALGEIGVASAAPRLRAIYEQDPGNQRIRLVLALKNLGDDMPLQKEVGRLSGLVTSSEDERVRRQAIRELSTLARDSSREIFSQALEDPSPLVRREAERALR